ncbi:MAG: FAD-dependent oxidoreductase [Candidatus Brocadiia bacterium]
MAEEQEWTKVAKLADLEDGVPISVEVGKATVLLVKRGDSIHACGGECTHYGAPLAEGVLRDRVVTCPWHNARLDVTTGEMVSPPALDPVARYEVKAEDGEVFVGPSAKARFPKPREEDGRTFVIVGGGAAGNAAAETLRREGFAGRVVLITREADGPYDRPNLSKEYLAGEAKPEWIPLRSEKFYANRNIELMTETTVTGLDLEAKAVELAGAQPLAFDRLLLATGATPRRLDIPGDDLDGVFLLRSLADARGLVGAAERASKAVVLGASFIAMEVASSLRKREVEVCVVAPEEVPMARVFGPRVGRRIQALHESHGVAFRLGHTAREFAGEGAVQAVVLDDGTRLEADLVVVGIGVSPVVDYLEGTGLVEDGAVPVDGRLQTRAEGVFAAGDIARVPHPRTGEPQRIEHWVVAERQGQHAARAMLGSDAAYDEVPFFWTKQYDASVKYAGHATRPDRIVYRGDVTGGSFLAGYYEQGTLKAAASLGMAKEIILLGEVLKAGRSPSPEELEDPATDLAQWL